ncbi:hypothetical protein [Elioraea sp.]|jgi:hypothetical protein|uniref:hypothetical protein n=1 Tax=Elioraea sp. TaxID=2185103 RepID=UPI0021DCC87F|nr:hypothetical protein [Elioraea sp.]GIX10687.1 MAG: hypothetical protein KatS3mg116_2397 [Elioraea sp.]
MKDTRSASQVMFGFLPEQTVDVRGGVWKVKRWRDPEVERSVHAEGLRAELRRLVSPWQRAGNDDGMAADMDRGVDVIVHRVSRDNGVQLEPYPRAWVCKGCDRVHGAPDAPCPCGDRRSRGQMPFVGFHEACGALAEPPLPRCPTHGQVKVVWPGTASAREIRFECPVPGCGRGVLRRGLGRRSCDCGGGDMTFTVHRAASVYTPRTCVIVNPPTREKVRALTEAGGPTRALEWVVSGMDERGPTGGRRTREAVERELRASGLPEAAIAAALQAMERDGHFAAAAAPLDLPPAPRAAAEEAAVTMALSVAEARDTVAAMLARSAGKPGLAELYGRRYPAALARAGLYAVDLIDRFPVLTAQFGFTRGSPEPGAGRLRPFRDREGRYTLHGELAETEALLVRLAPRRVVEWLRLRGHAALPVCPDDRSARIAILRHATVPSPGSDAGVDPVGADLLALIHSYAHRFVRQAAVFAGIDRNALSELLVPLHLGFYVYAAARGDFVLGGLQAVFESELNSLLDAVVGDEHRCALDPGCATAGGACPACLHLGEPSCRYFNRFLNRGTLFGQTGYIDGPLP